MPEDYHPPTKSDLLDVIRKERAALESLFEGLTDSQMIQPGVEASWSIKDILAHIASWERLAMDRVHAAESGDPLNFPLIKGDNDVDKFNADVYEKNNTQLLPDVTAEFHDSYRQFITQIENLDDDFLSKPLPFDWAGKLTAQVVISANTHWHYVEHAINIEKWLDKQG
jgi:hypothetical protein